MYTIIKDRDIDSVNERVSNMMIQNWKPSGSLVVVSDNYRNIEYYLQAMVKDV